MSSLDDNLVPIALACYSKVITRKRKIWSKQWLRKRQKYSHVNLMKELAIEKDDWFNYMRMDHVQNNTAYFYPIETSSILRPLKILRRGK